METDVTKTTVSGIYQGFSSTQKIPLRLSQSTLSVRPFLQHKSERHPKTLLETLDGLRNTGDLCDVTITVGSRRIAAHKVVLSACSPYFKAMFTGEMAESRQKEVNIKDVDEKATAQLIDFAYTGSIRIDESNVQTVLPAACLMQLSEIQEACCEFLKKQLDPTNCLGIRAFADTHACSDLLRVANVFSHHNFQDVMEGEEFLHLPMSQLIEILSSDELNVISEEQVYNSCMRWIRYNLAERKDKLHKVLQHVRLPLVSARFLVGVVSADLLIKNNDSCRDLVDEAKNYLLLPEQRLLMQGPRTRPRQPAKRGEVLFAVGGWCSGDAINSVER